EIDRTLYLDQPWFNGLTLFCIAVAAPYLGYTGWKDVGKEGILATAAWALLALAALLAYYGLCVLVNTTAFRVDDDWLTVKHGPLPWFGARKIPVDRITQLSTRMHHSRHACT